MTVLLERVEKLPTFLGEWKQLLQKYGEWTVADNAAAYDFLDIIDAYKFNEMRTAIDQGTIRLSFETTDKLQAELVAKENAKREVERQLEDCWIERNKAEAQLEKQRPLVEAVMDPNEIVFVGGPGKDRFIRAALKLREGEGE